MSKKVQIDTSAGVIQIELDETKAPLSCANFLAYVNQGHYDGTVFHRVIKGFMLQGGGFDVDMKQKPTLAAIRNEANNGLKNKRYTLAMARTNDPHSATAQFFINVKNNDFLDHRNQTAQGWGYCVFGEGAVFHQHGGQRLSGLPRRERARLGLCRVCSRDSRHRGGGPDREGAHRPQRLP